LKNFSFILNLLLRMYWNIFPQLLLWNMHKYRVSLYMKQLEWIIFLRAKCFSYNKYKCPSMKPVKWLGETLSKNLFSALKIQRVCVLRLHTVPEPAFFQLLFVLFVNLLVTHSGRPKLHNVWFITCNFQQILLWW